MCGMKKILQNISLFLIVLFIISTFCFKSYANTYGDLAKDAYSQLKQIVENSLSRYEMYQKTGGLERYCTVSQMVKDRDWIAYLYSKGCINKYEYNEYILRYKAYYLLAGVTFEPANINMDYQGNIRQEDLDNYFVEYVARTTMENMYRSMPNDLKNKTGIFAANSNKYGGHYDPWYLCPYGCAKLKDNHWSKVKGFDESCTHHSDNNMYSNVLISREEALRYKGISDKDLPVYIFRQRSISVRRDCSAYIGMVLANLNAEWLWDLSLKEYREINTDTIQGFEKEINKSNNFVCYSYNPDILQPGDIVVCSGSHTEMFMGWYDRNTYDVYQYSWGSTSDVESILDETGKVDYRRAHKVDKNYKMGADNQYKKIIRYTSYKPLGEVGVDKN